ncbi:MAG: hypothetical protein JO156_16225, partial [Solirubrobacterales bacterium]|nr:hypothetical protein [Solirubrobacterales bacterium]
MLLCLLVAAIALLSLGPRASAASKQLPAAAEVTVAPEGGGLAVPPSFAGLSTEYWALPHYARYASTFERALSLLTVPGGGPLVLRIGGDSADHTYWSPRRKPPRGAFELTPALLSQTSTLARQLGLRLILDLNLVADAPAMVGQWARAALADLPSGSIAGFEIGNEPDLYHPRLRNRLLSVSRARLGTSVLSGNYGLTGYIRDFHSYARTLYQLAPSVPLAGPALANPQQHVNWLSNLIAGQPQGLGMVSAHRYPLSPCVQGTPLFPTIARLLSEKSSAGLADTVRQAVHVAHGVGLPFRLTELNSVTCGGLAGVSDRFATALWAPDALFELLRAGVDGVNVHVRTNAINAAFTVGAGGFRARPLLYGLILFARTLGPDAQLVPDQLSASPALHLKAWAVRVNSDTLHVLLINKGQRFVTVTLRLPATGLASLARLLAPSPSATAQSVTLGGQQLSAAVTWTGQAKTDKITPVGGEYLVRMPATSAALLSVRLAPVALVSASGLTSELASAPQVTQSLGCVASTGLSSHELAWESVGLPSAGSCRA